MGTLLCLIPLAMAVGLTPAAMDWWADGPSVKLILIGGLCLFGIVFSINSSVHSFLIVAYSDRDKVALDVGFYYMANAAGRLLGTLLSGIVFQFLWACRVPVCFRTNDRSGGTVDTATRPHE